MKYSILSTVLVLLIGLNSCNSRKENKKEQPGSKPHDFMVALYDSLHKTPAQDKFNKTHPMPTGVVYVQHPGEGEKEIREHFRQMKKLGFNCLKQIMTVPGWTIEDVSLLALDEGLIPWWFGEGGWEEITPGLLSKLGIPANTPMSVIRNNERMVKYQKELMVDAVKKAISANAKADDKEGGVPRGGSVAYDPLVGGRGVELNETGEKLFLEWCSKTYGDISNLNKAWNFEHHGLQPPGGAFTSWGDFNKRWRTITGRECRNYFDILRFKVEHSLETANKRAADFKAFYPNFPFRAGGELGLFLPQAWYCVDLESIANMVSKYGSFYPSIHFVWHFNQVNGELERPFYMQASLAADYTKGAWAGAWEATGGPQQLSGEKEKTTAFTVDEGVMTQFVLSQIAGGFKGFGLWCWSVRTAGIEVGEYSLLDRNNQVGPRAIKVGKIAQAMNKYRDELWDAHKEPVVGVLTDWNNEAMMAVLSIKSRDQYKQDPINCRVGVSRALMNRNIPYEYVTTRDIRAGLASRYQAIYLPGNLVFTKDLMPLLTKYVEQGGRLIMDMPGAIMDEYSVIYPTGKGSDFEKLFGTAINDFQYSGYNIFNSVDNFPVIGFTIYASPSTANVLAKYDNGNPAIMENKLGKGTAVLIGYEASKMCFKPDNPLAESMLLKYALGDLTSPYKCEDALAYRLASPVADHYFILSDGKAANAKLTFKNFRYKSANDAVTGEPIDLSKTVAIQANNGRWIRCEKQSQ